MGFLVLYQGLKTQNWIFFSLFSLNTSHEKIPDKIVNLTYWHYIASDFQVYLWFVGTESKEDKEYRRNTINENGVTERINAIENDFSKSGESILEDFRTFKKSFLAEVNVSKKQLLTSYTTGNINKSNNSDRLIILLVENIAFLK